MIEIKNNTFVEISLSNLMHNFKLIKDKYPSHDILVSVKADAYGHGMKEIVNYLSQFSDGFLVATYKEAMELRRESDVRIICLQGPSSKFQAMQMASYNIAMVIHCHNQFRHIIEENLDLKELDLWIKFDSGMGRLGLDHETTLRAFEVLSPYAKKLTLMSHFSSTSSENFSEEFSKLQIKRFKSILNEIKQNGFSVKTSLSNSGGAINLYPDTFDIIRLGISVYGSSSSGSLKGDEFLNVMTLKSKIISLKEIGPGDSVGYDNKWVAKRKTKVAHLEIGYADGLSRRLSNNGKVLINGVYAKIIGNISMDLTAVDVTDIPNVKYLDEAIFWGGDLNIDLVARLADRIPYELMTSISDRVERVYIK